VVRTGWIVGTFLAMYLIATILGFVTYLLLSPLAMWISVFTVMPVLSALLIYVYFRRIKFSQGASLRESLVVTAAWIVLSFGLDAVVYIVIIPFLSHVAPNWTFFRDQSRWIWLSYVVLLFSGLAVHQAYGRKANA
jgi:hypothetical protein